MLKCIVSRRLAAILRAAKATSRLSIAVCCLLLKPVVACTSTETCVRHQMVASLLLPLTGANITVKVHPVVLLQICDAYIRRNDKQDRVIGTLLGTATEGVVTVSRCYVVPHTESADQVSSYAISSQGRLCCMQQRTSQSAAFEQHAAADGV